MKRSKRIVVIAVAASLALVASLALHRPLIAWFSGRDPTSGQSSMSSSPPPASPSHEAARLGRLQPLTLPPTALGAVQEAMASLEEIRAKLAADSLDGVADRARRVQTMLRDAADSVDSIEAKASLTDGAKAADALARSATIDDARKSFAATTTALIALAAADARLQAGWKIFECPMVEGENRWLQRGDTLENPYMGKKMLACGSPSTFTVPAPSTMPSHEHAAGGDASEVEYYTCSMHPSVKQAAPGKCPICSMDLTPVTKGELESGVVIVDDIRRQKIGVKTAKVERRALGASLTTVGRVVVDEEQLYDVTLRIGGFVEELYVDETGQKVRKGQALLTLYSPELYAAQVEYLQALKTQKTLGGSGFSESLVRSAKRRLELWDVSDAQIERLVERGEATDKMPILAPANGYVVEKNIVKGAKIEEGATVYRLANLDVIWVEADVYEADLPRVKLKQPATVTLPYLPGKELTGEVTFIHPFLDKETRTGRVRVGLKNPGLDLKPEMYANVAFQSGAQGDALVVPESAVVYTGPRRLVFVDLGEGRLKPVVVKLGRKTSGLFEVLDGLKDGDVVVTSGNFLIAAESRLKGAAQYWAEDTSGASSQPAAESQPAAATAPSPAPSAAPSAVPPAMRSPRETPRAAALSVTVALDKDPPAQNGNAVVVDVRDASGKPVTGATVKVEYRMPAMGAMPEMRGGAHVEGKGAGRYVAHFDLPMAGSWTLTTTVASPAGSAQVAHGLTVGKRGLHAQ